MTIADSLLQELDQETQTTRRVLERVPNDKLDWRPAPRARTLGQLALHIAQVPGAVASFATAPSPVQAPTFTDPSPQSAAELLPILEESVAKAKQLVAALDDQAITAPWTMMSGNRELFTVPRIAMLRSIMLNHWYHHRGQLTVYLRLLGVAIPSVYGPSADENPFA
ncbi:MAG TPA: DinB family protein [Thermoanaerobaculia bacterium]|jgi:uncharacterized damage-inducible protein DinB|nr:DinB family protein [Thermoanaerobaculia bacterium]